MRRPPDLTPASKEEAYEAARVLMREIAGREHPLPPALRDRLAGKTPRR